MFSATSWLIWELYSARKKIVVVFLFFSFKCNEGIRNECMTHPFQSHLPPGRSLARRNTPAKHFFSILVSNQTKYTHS